MVKGLREWATSRLWPARTRKESYEVAPHSENADLQLPCAAKKWRGVAPLVREPGRAAWVRLQHLMHALNGVSLFGGGCISQDRPDIQRFVNILASAAATRWCRAAPGILLALLAYCALLLSRSLSRRHLHFLLTDLRFVRVEAASPLYCDDIRPRVSCCAIPGTASLFAEHG